jgi:site-specific DNA recombinase
VQGGKVDVVLAQDRDRFAREPAYHYLLKREFQEHGTRIRSLNDRGDDSPEGELTDGILDQLGRYERAKTAERSRRGKLRRAREGKVIAGTRSPYGFVYNDARDNYVVDPERMAVVHRIFEMLGTEGATLYAVRHELKRTGIPSPSGNVLWPYPTLRAMVLDDVYRPHTYEEIAEVVSPEVAARLQPERSYGIWWFNRRRGEMRKVAEVGPNGKRIYRKRYKQVRKPRSEWVAVPVPASGIPRGWVDAARLAIKDNKRPSNTGRRFWPLSGGVLRCPACGWSMSPHTISPGGKCTRFYYYYRCAKHMKNSYDGCASYRHYRAEELEEQVWGEIRGLLRDPERLRAGMDAAIEMQRSALRGDPDRETRAWLDKLAEVDRKRARYQEMAAEELITLEELRGKLADLEDIRATAERELEEVQGRSGRIAELERDRDALLESYEALALEELDELTPEERHGFYRTLRVVVHAYPDGSVEVRGEFMPFGPPGPDDPPAAASLLEGFPQIKTCERSMGAPGLGERTQVVRLRQGGQPVGPLDGPPDAQVPHGQDVRSPEKEHQEHVGAPLAQALDGRDPFCNLIVGERVQALQLELSALDAPRQVAKVAYLLPREPGCAQIRFFGGDELGWRRGVAPEEADEAGVDGAGRHCGELLPYDGTHEGAVSVVGASAAARRAVERTDALYEGGHDRVPALEQKAKARVLDGGRGHSGSGRDLLYRPKKSLAAGLIISGFHIGSKVSWAFTVSTPSMLKASVSTCSWIRSPTGHIGLVSEKVTSRWRPSSWTPTS